MTWDNPVNKIVLGPELLKEMEQEVVNIRKNLKASLDRHKIHANKHRVNREFNVGDHLYLRVRERKSSLKLGSCAKLSPRYCGPFEGQGRCYSKGGIAISLFWLRMYLIQLFKIM